MSTTTSSTNPVTIEAVGGEPHGKTMRILFADKAQQCGVDALEAANFEISLQPDLSADDLPDAIRAFDPDVLVVRSTKVKEAALAAAERLSLIVRAGAGYDTIDVAGASRRGIFVANCPGKNAIAVAELVWGLILSCDRRIPDQTIDLRAGTWDKKNYSKAPGLYGRTLGVVGLGTIGLEVASRGRAFGMHVMAWSRSLTEQRANELGVGYCSKLINLAKMSDVISVNVSATKETEHLINEQFCQAMKPGAYLINTSRGSVVDEGALTEAIRTRQVRAGLDVYANEPASGDSTFADQITAEPCVYGTHHIGASTDQAQDATIMEAVRIIQTYRDAGQVINCVNRAVTTIATCLLTVRHLNKPGVLAHVFYTLGQAGINVEEMENLIYEGEEAACARIQLSEHPGDDAIQLVRGNEHVLSVAVTDISH